MLGSTLIFTCFSFYARCAATLTVVSARDSGMVFAQPPQRNSQQTFLSLGAEMKSYSFLHSLYKFFDLIISPKHLAVNLFYNLTLKRTRSAGLLRLLRRFVFSRHTSNAKVRLIRFLFYSENTMKNIFPYKNDDANASSHTFGSLYPSLCCFTLLSLSFARC